MSFVVANQPSTLFELLHYCWRDALFPREVDSLEGGWGVPEEKLERFEEESALRGWDLRKVSRGGDKIALADLTGGFLRQPPSRLRQRVDASRRSPGFLLAARDKAQAQRLLGALTTVRCREVQVISVHPANGEFRYLWSVNATAPPLAALQAAAASWHQPVSGAGFLLFTEWPFTLALDQEVVRRIDWQANGGIVLLGQEAPTVSVIQGEWGRPLVEVSRIELGRAVALPIGAEPAPTEFSVHLRFVRKETQSRLERRIDRLEKEIKAKNLVLEKLKEDLQTRKAREQYQRQPMFLFFEPNESDIPFSIRRLLLDWSDHPEELNALLYARVAPNGPDPACHILTTRAALSRQAPTTADALLALRLGEYRPTHGIQTQFEGLRRWAEHGLFLFVPVNREEELTLYPEFESGRLTAEKLRRTLMTNRAPADWEDPLLLTPLPSGGLAGTHVSRGLFRPLAESVDWKCPLETLPVHAAPSMGRFRRGFETSIRGAIDQAANDFIKTHLTPTIEQAAADVQAIEDQLKLLTEASERLRRTLSGWDRTLQLQIDSARSASRRISSLEGQPNLLQTLEIAKNLGRLGEEFQSLSEQGRELESELAAILKQLEAPSEKSDQSDV